MRSNRRKRIYHIELFNFAPKILKMLTPFIEDYHTAIIWHTSSVSDLITLNAKYHQECYKKLINDHGEKLKERNTKYIDKINQAMEEIYNIMLPSDEYKFSITQLIEAVKISDIIPHENTIKNH